MGDNRQKGHRFERYIANIWRELGSPKSKTARACNRILDNCGIDIALNGTSLENIPLLIQCKSGYLKNRIKPEEEMKKIKTALSVNFDENHDIHNKPIVIMNKIDRKEILVTVNLDFFIKLYKVWIINQHQH